jgi:hypothetical protein
MVVVEPHQNRKATAAEKVCAVDPPTRERKVSRCAGPKSICTPQLLRGRPEWSLDAAVQLNVVKWIDPPRATSISTSS